jgi:hypothetical protein
MPFKETASDGRAYSDAFGVRERELERVGAVPAPRGLPRPVSGSGCSLTASFATSACSKRWSLKTSSRQQKTNDRRKIVNFSPTCITAFRLPTCARRIDGATGTAATVPARRSIGSVSSCASVSVQPKEPGIMGTTGFQTEIVAS